ncbi:unnamed protein product, partial [marine sediment metagenome]
MAWENLLEESFIRYLVGAKSGIGYKPKRFVNPKNMAHALRMISGKRYFKWNSASEIIALSELYLGDGEPYKPILQGVTTFFDEMNIIRNRIVHKSTFAKDKFNHFIRETLGHGIRLMTPGRFL